MRTTARRIATILLVAGLTPAVAVPASAVPGGSVPGGSNAFGRSALGWQEAWIGWTFGSSTNPLLDDASCGEVVDGVFFLRGSFLGGEELSCEVPSGTPLLAAPGGTVAWWGVDAETEPGLLAARDALLAPLSNPSVVLDGRSLPVADAFALSGVYPIDMEPGNFMETLGIPVVEDPLRVASGGWFVRIRPLRPGEHTLVLSSEFAGSPATITFHLTVVSGRA
jgi:hypothetical protein